MSPTPIRTHPPATQSHDGRDSHGSHGSPRARAGRRGEEIAARYLAEHDWRILDRNWRPGTGMRGELDIVALEPSTTGTPTLVVVEVKTRSGLSAGPPAGAVDADKLQRMRTLAAAWASQHRGVTGRLRLDVVSVLLHPDRPASLRHHRGVGL